MKNQSLFPPPPPPPISDESQPSFNAVNCNCGRFSRASPPVISGHHRWIYPSPSRVCFPRELIRVGHCHLTRSRDARVALSGPQASEVQAPVNIPRAVFRMPRVHARSYARRYTHVLPLLVAASWILRSRGSHGDAQTRRRNTGRARRELQSGGVKHEGHRETAHSRSGLLSD